MLDFPVIFKEGHKEYKSKTEAITDAKIGWQLCQDGKKLPVNFSRGMLMISGFVKEKVNQNNYQRLWVKIKIKEDRQARKMTQVEYANLFNVSTNTVKAWENGRREPAAYFWFLLTFSTTALKEAKKGE